MSDKSEVADDEPLAENVFTLVVVKRGDSDSVEDTVTQAVTVGLAVRTGDGESFADAEPAGETLSPVDALGAADVELETTVDALVDGDPLVRVLIDGVADVAVEKDLRGVRVEPVDALAVRLICGDVDTDGVTDLVKGVDADDDGDAVALRVPVELTVVDAENVEIPDCVVDTVLDGNGAEAVAHTDVDAVGDLDTRFDTVITDDAENDGLGDVVRDIAVDAVTDALAETQADVLGESVLAKDRDGVGVVDEDCDASELADVVKVVKPDDDADIENDPVSHEDALRVATTVDELV